MRKDYEHKRRWGFDQNLNVLVSQKLKAKRESMRISQPEMALRMKTTQATISRIERAEDNLTLTKLEKYVSALGIEITIKLPLNGRKEDILCKVFQSNLEYFHGIHLAKSIGHEGGYLRPIKDPTAYKRISHWSKKNSIISCNSVGLYHELSLPN